jgi:hypothetical protein
MGLAGQKSGDSHDHKSVTRGLSPQGFGFRVRLPMYMEGAHVRRVDQPVRLLVPGAGRDVGRAVRVPVARASRGHLAPGRVPPHGRGGGGGGASRAPPAGPAPPPGGGPAPRGGPPARARRRRAHRRRPTAADAAVGHCGAPTDPMGAPIASPCCIPPSAGACRVGAPGASPRVVGRSPRGTCAAAAQRRSSEALRSGALH